MKSLTSEQRNSCLFFQLLLLFFGESCLILLTECSVTAGPQIKEEREGGERGKSEGKGGRLTGNHVFTVPGAALKINK